MANLEITKVKDVYSAKNISGASLDYIFTTIKSCSKIETKITGTLAINEVYVLPITDDATYTLSVGTEVYSLTTLLVLQKDYIQNIADTLCICGCNPCGDSDTPTETLITAMARSKALINLSSPKYTTYVNSVLSQAECTVYPDIYCEINQENITGTFKFQKDVAKRLLALDYLAMYYAELNSVIDQNEKDFITEKFKFEQISCCLESLGISVREAKEDVENLPVLLSDMVFLHLISIYYSCSATIACAGTNTISVWVKVGETFSTATKIWANSLGTIEADAGYYSDGVNSRNYLNGVLGTTVTCSTTNIPPTISNIIIL